MNLIIKKDIAYQEDRTKSIEYGDKYYAKIEKHKDKADMNYFINVFRSNLVYRNCINVLDIGCGNGEFIKAFRGFAYGYDIIPKTVDWLQKEKIYIDPYKTIPPYITGFSFWDSLEHIAEPAELIDKLPKLCYIYISIPIFEVLNKVTESKHYRPNEHYWYFTENGLINFMNECKCDCHDISNFETLQGRDSILTFVFRKRG